MSMPSDSSAGRVRGQICGTPPSPPNGEKTQKLRENMKSPYPPRHPTTTDKAWSRGFPNGSMIATGSRLIGQSTPPHPRAIRGIGMPTFSRPREPSQTASSGQKPASSIANRPLRPRSRPSAQSGRRGASRPRMTAKNGITGALRGAGLTASAQGRRVFPPPHTSGGRAHPHGAASGSARGWRRTAQPKQRRPIGSLLRLCSMRHWPQKLTYKGHNFHARP